LSGCFSANLFCSFPSFFLIYLYNNGVPILFFFLWHWGLNLVLDWQALLPLEPLYQSSKFIFCYFLCNEL
jgi:hypothetical protein